MYRHQGDRVVLHDRAEHKYADINAQFGQRGKFWDSQCCHGDEFDAQRLGKFTTSIFLAAPPPSMSLKMLRESYNKDAVVNSENSVSRSLQRSRSPARPAVQSNTHAFSESENAPKKLLTSSFYTTTRPFPTGHLVGIIPPEEDSSSRRKNNSVTNADSGIVCIDISLPSQNKLVIDSQNSYSLNSSEMIYSSGENSSDAGCRELGNSSSHSSTCQVPAYQKPVNKSTAMVSISNRRASFEIQSTDSNPAVVKSYLEIPGYRRHSVQTTQSAGFSDGHFPVEDVNNNKYKDFEEDVLVDLLKKCTDFPERRKIRSALRHVRENLKVSDDNSSSADAPVVVSMAALLLSGDTECLVPVYTSTPREVADLSPDENDNLFVSTPVMYKKGQDAESNSYNSHVGAPVVKSSRQEIHLVFGDSQYAKKSSASSGDKREQNGGTVNTIPGSSPKISSAGKITAEAVTKDSHPEKTRVKSSPHGTQTAAFSAASSTAKTSIKVKLADARVQQKSASKLSSNRAKSAGSVRELSKDAKTSSVPISHGSPVQKVRETSSTNGAKKLPDDLKYSPCLHSPRGKDVRTSVVQKSAKSVNSSSKQIALQQTSQIAKAKSPVCTRKGVQTRAKVIGSKSSVIKTTSDSVVVAGANENILIPKIVISDENDLDNECEKLLGRQYSSPVSPKQEVHPNKLQEKQKYYRRKRPKVVSPIPEGEDHKMAAVVTMETVSPVREAGDSAAVKMNVTSGHDNSSQSGADLERAFTDLLDNFDKLGENEDTIRSSKKEAEQDCVTGDQISCDNKTCKVSGDISQNIKSEEKEVVDSCESTVESVVTDQGEASLLSDMSANSPMNESTSPLVANEGFDLDRLGDVVIEESEEGALTATDVQELEQGQRKVSVTTKKQRTGSDAEYQDKETTVITTFKSPSGTKYEEQDVIKTRRKLTPKGSIYVKRDTVRTKRALTTSGEQTVEEDHIVETDNKSVSLGKSWGDKTLTTVLLSKPTKRNRAITSIQEETTTAKPVEESSSKEGIPDITQPLGDQDADVGSMITLRCQGTGVPTPEVTWYAGSSAVTETAYFKPSFDGKTAKLIITEVFPDDEQVFRCVFKNRHGSAETSCNLTVTEVTQEEVPSISSALEDVEASPGDVVTMQCGVRGLGGIFWHKEGTRLTESHKYAMEFEDGTARLRIRDVAIEDAGQYSCSVKNTAGESSTICELSVTVEGCPPDILNPLFNCSATSGKPFKLMCRISGDPEPVVNWYHEGRELLETDSCKPSYVDNIARLELKPVSELHGGMYECVGKNAWGSASTSCELRVTSECKPAKASLQLSIKAVSKSADEGNSVDKLDESGSSASSPNSSQTVNAKDSDIYSTGEVRSCTPPPQVAPVSCSPPPRDVLPRSFSSQSKFLATSPDQNGGSSAMTNGQSDTKTNAVNRLSSFFGDIMNNSSSSSPAFSYSPSTEVQTETKSSFVVKRRENGSFKSDSSTETAPSTKRESGADSGSQPAATDSGFDLSTIHRDIIMSAKIQEIEDEEELHKMLNTTDNFEDRKMIRARLKELREKAREEWERGRKEREAAAVDVVKLRQQRAEEDKKKKMQSFQARAETAGKDLEDKYLVQTQKDLKDRQKFAADEKQKKLEAYKQIAKTGSGVTTTKQSTTDKDGKTTTTTMTKTVTVQQSGFGGVQYGAPGPKPDDVANNLANKLHQVTSPYTSGKITVRTESWNSQEGVVKKTETTQRWGANKPAGPKSAMAAFKQMDSLNPSAATKPNALVTVSLAKKAATTMRRNAVQIKAEILEFCKSNTAEYKSVQITNFSSSWNNGMAFCALIHHFYPDAFDFSTLDPKQRRKNFELAFDTAEKCADIAPLLDVEDMVKMKNPDWKCVFTYVQSFYRHLRNHPNCKQIVPPSQ